jgi:hypothetical protein
MVGSTQKTHLHFPRSWRGNGADSDSDSDSSLFNVAVRLQVTDPAGQSENCVFA